MNSLNFYVYQNALNYKSHYGCPIFQKAFLSKFVIKFLEKKSILYLSFSLHCFSLTLFYHICCLLALISTSEIWMLLFPPAAVFPGEFSYPPSLCTPGQIQPSFTSFFWGGYVWSLLLHGLSLVAASGGYSSLWCAVFSLRWLLLLRSMGSRPPGFSSCSTWAQ